MTTNLFRTTVFVPNGDDRKATAILLVGTADEFGVDQRSIRPASGGFYITEALADILDAEMDVDDEADEDPTPTKKTSGNRAAKRSNQED